MLTMHRSLGTWQRCVDRYIATTEFARAKFIAGGLPAEKITVKPNFCPADPGVGLGEGGYALFVGRLSAEKGIGTLMNAWRRLGRVGGKRIGHELLIPADDLGRRAGAGQTSAVHEDDAVAQAIDGREIVGNEQERRPFTP